MSKLDYDPILLAKEGERLPAIKSWLVDTIWNKDRYQQLGLEDYLASGESAVCKLEELISTGAMGIWDELEADSDRSPTLKTWLGIDAPLPLVEPHAAVVFDGLSLRELPLLLKNAEESGFRVKSVKIVATSLPTETKHYIEQRVIGRQIAPSQLRGRTELAEKNVEAFYLDQPNTRERFASDHSLLIWSSYPDRLYSNDEARNDALFTTFHRDHISVIWKCTVQSIPSGIPIVVTSDHGYVFFGVSLESTRQSDAPNLLGQSRWKKFEPHEQFPEWNPDMQLLKDTRIAMLRGRLRTRPQGQVSRKLYQHGGFSLMETLVPWIELERI